MFGETSVLQHYKTVNRSDCQSLRSIRAEIPDKDATQPADIRASILTRMDPGSVALKSPAYSKVLTPRPSQFLIRQLYKGMGVRDTEVERFLSETLLPMAGIAMGNDNRKGSLVSAAGKSACSSAEPFYTKALKQSRTGQYNGQPSINVYYDQDGQPLAFQKHFDTASALLLQGLDADGVLLPAGTIVGIGRGDFKKVNSVSPDNHHTLTALEIVNALPVMPNRLSPWAYSDGLDRAIYGASGESGEFDPTRADLVQSVSLDDFRKAAHQVMAMCGVAA